MHDPSIVSGLRAEVAITVRDHDTAIAMGSGSVAVLATPRIVALVEAAAVAAVADRLAPGMTTVGTHITLDHIAPSPVGRDVVAHAEVTAVDGRRSEFAVWATMGDAEVARGVHRRVTVARETFGRPG
jgi:predicted thioesterase